MGVPLVDRDEAGLADPFARLVQDQRLDLHTTIGSGRRLKDTQVIVSHRLTDNRQHSRQVRILGAEGRIATIFHSILNQSLSFDEGRRNSGN